MTTTTVLRDPMPLPQVERNSCQSCVTAQARWMLGLSDLTGQDAVREMDRLTGRQPGAGIPVSFSVPVLLEDGCEVVCYGPPDIDRDRLHREGLSYFREYYSREWTADDESYWTEERLAAFAERSEAERATKAAAEQRFGWRLGRGPEFTIRHAESLLAGGWLILTTYVEDHGPGTSHATLVYGRDGSAFSLYTPRYREPGLEEASWQTFAGMVRPYAVAARVADR